PASHVLTLARGGGIKRGLQNLLGGIVDFSTDSVIREKVKKLPTIITKTRGASIGETGAGDIDRIGSRIMRSKFDTWNDTLAKLADSIEFWLTGTASASGYREAAKLGLKGRDADIFADWLGGATQSRYNKEARPIIMNNILFQELVKDAIELWEPPDTEFAA
ncbi:MAG: hypothetical protein IIB17_10905, partial [Chloroflexi bacterium]|nr:hypothetical protein [Chloroflexota bacterium]